MPRVLSSNWSVTTRWRWRARSRSSPRGQAGSRSSRADVEQLATPGREAAAWALTDAWGQRDLPALLEACELALERKEPFLLAVGLASHVGRVRAAQALAEEGLGATRDRRSPEDEGVSRAEGPTARGALLAGRARHGSRPPRRARCRAQGWIEALGRARAAARADRRDAACRSARDGRRGLAPGDEPRRLRLLARRGVPVDRPARSGAVDPSLESGVLGAICFLSPAWTAASSRRVMVLTVERKRRLSSRSSAEVRTRFFCCLMFGI